MGEISDKYRLNSTPVGWTFSIWAIIFTGLVFYGVFLTALYRIDPLVCVASFSLTNVTLLSISFIGMTAWLFLFDREWIIAAAIVLPILTILAAMATFRINRTLIEAEASLRPNYRTWILSLVSVNVMAIYSTWTTCASLLNFGIFLQYKAGSDPATIEWFIPLLALVVIVVIGILVALGLTRSFYHVNLRYLLGIPFVFIWANCGIRDNSLGMIAESITTGGLVFASAIAIEMSVGIGINEIKVHRND